ncbi:MAG: LysM peptidoglycan-binding domain-containing protein [Phycisphaerales bacterium]
MDERSSRIFFGLCMLVLVWIGVYWMWRPSVDQDPVISFDDQGIAGVLGTESSESGLSVTDMGMNEASGDASDDSNGHRALLTKDRSAEATEASGATAPGDGSRLIPPEFFDHVVAEHELMQTIAKRYFGSVDDWWIIAKANPRVDPRKLKPGMVLRIPKDRNNIQGLVIGKESEPGVLDTPVLDSAGSESKVIEYVVQSGDSLSKISQRIYGSAQHAEFIFESNRNVLRSMDDISIGQLLRLPPLPSQGQTDGDE